MNIGGVQVKKESKKIRSARFIERYQSFFVCPICQADMYVKELKSLVCAQGHTFDFAKQGYVNFLNHPVQSKYGKDFFEARRTLLCESDFYTPLQKAVSEAVYKCIGEKDESVPILDAGCGEGTYLHNVTANLSKALSQEVIGVGVDLSKEGIIVAARNYDKHIWTVADLANMPFRDDQFAMILNVFSPSNYKEFHRLLKKDGIVLKVVPEENYLQELRAYAFHSRYSNEEIVTRFTEQFQIVEEKRITYTTTLAAPLLQTFLAMTPLAWSMEEEKREQFLEQDTVSMTVDASILIGKYNP